MALVCVNDYESAAFKRVPKEPMDYYKSGAGDELSLRLNRTTWDKYDFYTTTTYFTHLVNVSILNLVFVCDHVSYVTSLSETFQPMSWV